MSDGSILDQNVKIGRSNSKMHRIMIFTNYTYLSHNRAKVDSLGVWEVVVDFLVHDVEYDIQEVPETKKEYQEN